MHPVIGWEIVETEELLFILGQAFAGGWELRFVEAEEFLVSFEDILLRYCHLHVVDSLLRLALSALGHLVEDVGGLVNPAALGAGGGELFGSRRPETLRTIASSQSWELLQPSVFQVPENFLIGQFASPVAIKDRQKFLFTLPSRSDHHHNAAALIVLAHVEVNPIAPDVHVMLAGKIALALIFKVVENFSAKLRMTTSYASSHQITIEKDVTRYIEP